MKNVLIKLSEFEIEVKKTKIISQLFTKILLVLRRTKGYSSLFASNILEYRIIEQQLD